MILVGVGTHSVPVVRGILQERGIPVSMSCTQPLFKLISSLIHLVQYKKLKGNMKK